MIPPQTASRRRKEDVLGQGLRQANDEEEEQKSTEEASKQDAGPRQDVKKAEPSTSAPVRSRYQ